MEQIIFLTIEYTDIMSCHKYDGKECSANNLFPLGTIDPDDETQMSVKMEINVNDGVVLNWPQGHTGRIYSKPVDSGVYTFTDAGGNTLKQIADYVIDGLDIDSEGWGDYIIMTINEDGKIKNWNKSVIMDVLNGTTDE